MPRRFFRKFAFKRHEYGEKWFLAPFSHLMHDHRLWSIRRKNVVPAVALGAFFAFMPFPGHPLWASLAALALRVNVPIAALTTFISNPVTMGPMYFFAYRLGEAVRHDGVTGGDRIMSMDHRPRRRPSLEHEMVKNRLR